MSWLKSHHRYRMNQHGRAEIGRASTYAQLPVDGNPIEVTPGANLQVLTGSRERQAREEELNIKCTHGFQLYCALSIQ